MVKIKKVEIVPYITVWVLTLLNFLVNYIHKVNIIGFSYWHKYEGMQMFFDIAIQDGIFTGFIFIVAIFLPFLLNDKLSSSSIRYYIKYSINTTIAVIAAYLVFMAICYIQAGSETFYMEQYDMRAFEMLQITSIFDFVILFFANVCLATFTMCMLTSSLAALIKNKTLVLVIGILLYYSYVFIPVRFEFEVISFLIPSRILSFLHYSFNFAHRLYEFVLITVLSIVLWMIGKNGHCKRNCKEIRA